MLKVLEHPLITHKLTQMRRKECGTKDFRANLDEIAGLMAYEISRDLPLRTVDIETPVSPLHDQRAGKGYRISTDSACWSGHGEWYCQSDSNR